MKEWERDDKDCKRKPNKFKLCMHVEPSSWRDYTETSCYPKR